MKILYVHSRYRSTQPSGENDTVDRDVALLATAGHDVALHERHSDDIAGMGLGLKALVPVRAVWSPAERRRLETVLVHSRPDVVHVHNTFPMLSPSVLLACRDAGVPVVATLHNFRLSCANSHLLRDGRPCDDCVGRLPVPALRHRCYRGSLAATVPMAAVIGVHSTVRTWPRHTDAFITMTAFHREVMVRAGFPRERFHVVPHGLPDTAQRRGHGPGELLLFVGRLSPEKGVDLLREAYERSGCTLPLHLVGDGPLAPQVRDWAATRAEVTFHGRLDSDELAALIMRARAVVVPSRWYETFGLVAVEALRAGVPVIAPDHGVFPEVVSSDAGLLVAPNDAGALAAALDRVAGDDRLVVEAGRAARLRFESRYTEQRHLAALTDVYRSVSERSTTAHHSSPRRTP